MKLNMPEPEVPEPTESKNEEEEPPTTVDTTVTETKTESPPPPVREVSQTDHLNKKLLTSLFKRMDEGGDSLLCKMLDPDEVTTCDDDWE